MTQRGVLYFIAGAVAALAGSELLKGIHPGPLPLAPESPAVTIRWLPDTVTRWNGHIVEMAGKYRIDPNALAIIMTLESGGYIRAHSAADAKGLMQITPPAEKDIAAKFLQENRDTYDIWDPRTNIEFGTAYLAYLRNEFGEKGHAPSWNSTVELVAAGYNDGPGAANQLYKGEGLESIETLSYSRDALNMWRERNAEISPAYERWYERGGSSLVNAARAKE